MRVSFRAKIIVTIVAAVWLAQIATLWAVLDRARVNVEQRVGTELNTAANVFDELLSSRAELLLRNVAVLASDFGFKAAAASGDVATIVSALDNHGRDRAGADLVALVSLEGALIAATDDAALQHEPLIATLVADAQREGFLLTNANVDGQMFQLVLTPVLAPKHIAWVLMGFRIDRSLVLELKGLTGLEVSILALQQRSVVAASTLPESLRPALGRLLHEPINDRVQMGEASFFTRVHELSSHRGRLVAVLQQPAALALTLYRAIRIETAFFGGIASLLAVLGALYLSRGISAPVNALAKAAKKVAVGEYDAPVTVNSSDELGLLARAFNDMREGIAMRERKIAFFAHYDELTRLPNRLLAREHLTQAIERCKRSGSSLSLALLSALEVKSIGAALGQDVADRLLSNIAQRLTQRLRGADAVARVGGDDFLVLLEGADAAAARGVVDELAALVSRRVDIDGATVGVSVATGLALFPDHGSTAEQLLRRAEIAAQEAKERGMSFAVYELGRDESQRRQLAIVGDLRTAIDTDGLSLVYQPKIDVASGRPTEVEALIRWRHPRLGAVSPEEFIPLAERSGNISLLSDWVLTAALRQAAAWQSQSLPLSVGINLSAHDLLDANFATRLAAQLLTHDVPAERVLVEVTESAIMQDVTTACTVLAELRGLGVRVAIDDFGTGYSSLAQLKALPADELKIDKSFVLELAKSDDDVFIVESTVALAHRLGLVVTAEGVEDELTCQLLSRMGCDKLQGYFYSKPLSPSDFDQWLSDFPSSPSLPKAISA